MDNNNGDAKRVEKKRMQKVKNKWCKIIAKWPGEKKKKNQHDSNPSQIWVEQCMAQNGYKRTQIRHTRKMTFGTNDNLGKLHSEKVNP